MRLDKYLENSDKYDKEIVDEVNKMYNADCSTGGDDMIKTNEDFNKIFENEPIESPHLKERCEIMFGIETDAEEIPEKLITYNTNEEEKKEIKHKGLLRHMTEKEILEMNANFEDSDRIDKENNIRNKYRIKDSDVSYEECDTTSKENLDVGFSKNQNKED